jgi:diguanylate cyclase (GGDEF)-like protein
LNPAVPNRETAAPSRRRRIRLQSVVLTAAVAVLLLVQLVAANRRAGQMVGMAVGRDLPGGGLVVDAVDADGPAARAGLRADDRLTAVDGQPVPGWRGYRQRAAGFRAGEGVDFAVLRGDQELHLTVRPGMPLHWQSLLVNALSVLAYLALALLALRQQEEDLRARLLCLFSLAVIAEFLLPELAGPLGELALRPAFYLVTGLQIGLEVHLVSLIAERVSLIPERQPRRQRVPWLVPLFYLLGSGFGVLGALTQLAASGLPLRWPWSVDAFDAVLYDVVFPLWALTVVVLLASSTLRHPEPQKRQQAGLVLLGTLPWAIVCVLRLGYTLADLVEPGWIGTLEPLALFCGPVAMLVAISRYQLFDLEVVVRRGLVYTALTTMLLLLFYAALGAGGVLFSEFVAGGDRVWVVAVATLILGLVFTPLRRGLERLIYRRFFPERLALRERLTTLAAELPALGKLPLMGERLVHSLGDILGITSSSLLIADPASGVLMTLSSTGDPGGGLERSLLLSPSDPGLRLLTRSGCAFPTRQLAAKSTALAQRLDALQAQVAVPLLSQGRLIGLLLLGAKRKRDRYLAEEMELLNLLAQHVAIVFENARLFESATRDGLTGLLRREAVLERLDAELQRAVRYGRPLTVGMADLDHFKAVNDRYGHLTGDSVLNWVAHVLQSGLRATDHVGRYGGEEFLLVLPETDLAGALAVAEKVRAVVEQQAFVGDEGERVRLTVSIGLATLAEVSPERVGHRDRLARQLIAAADRSLYRAKGEGRNRVVPAEAGITA